MNTTPADALIAARLAHERLSKMRAELKVTASLMDTPLRIKARHFIVNDLERWMWELEQDVRKLTALEEATAVR